VKKTINYYTSLLDKFKQGYSKEHQTSLKNVLVILCAILVKETVNLNKLKNQVGVILGNTDTKAESHYKRLTRFFNEDWHQFTLWKVILQVIVKCLLDQLDGRKGGKFLLLDGTSWELGVIRIQLLVLSLVYNGVAIPIFWINLAKKGHSNFNERKRLLQMAACLYDLQGMTLIADREYIGREWFTWLKEEMGLDWVIRLPFRDYKQEISQGKKSYSALIKRARAGKTVAQPVVIGGQSYQFVAFKNEQATTPEEELVLLLTSLKANKKRIARIYGLRWHIECMFKNLKSNGFHLEELSLTQPAKLRLLVTMVIAAYVLCITEGIKQLRQIPTRTTQEGKQTRYESIFRKGYSMVNLQAQTIGLFLQFLLTTLGKPIRTLKPT
jgi:hypothetical protein